MTELVVFAYNFPHKKTQDILFHLFVRGYKIKCILAAEKVKLSIPSSTIHTKINHIALLHPREIAKAIGADYIVVPHNSSQCIKILSEIKPDLGIIAGARILKKEVIEKFRIGIINLHPGLIPECRGLDAMLWSIYKGIPLGVTAHLIDERIDAGKILIKKRIPIFEKDTLLDLSERLYETQLEILPEAIKLALEGKWEEVKQVGTYNSKMPPDKEKQVIQMFENYKIKFIHRG